MAVSFHNSYKSGIIDLHFRKVFYFSGPHPPKPGCFLQLRVYFIKKHK